ncbi:hypothetical protein [Methylobacterium sp. 092160098-2]|jgi:hypothetical protein|uniref:hypothetical protein n=1 Tax=Methylobacterium sp. 092160098-2 TaxID=3025129 RepID=UPI003158C3A6
MLNDETVIVPDVNLDPRVPVAPYRTKDIRSLVMTPIGSPEPVAALGAYWSAIILPDDATLARIGALVAQASAALARIQAQATHTMDAAWPDIPRPKRIVRRRRTFDLLHRSIRRGCGRTRSLAEWAGPTRADVAA